MRMTGQEHTKMGCTKIDAPVIRLARLALLVGAVLSGVAATASELLVEGRVVRVEPVMAVRQVVEQVGDCDPVRPADVDLVALLAWDLRSGCRTQRREQQVVAGYRVFYEWEDRVYDRVMDERPGDTLPLRVRLD